MAAMYSANKLVYYTKANPCLQDETIIQFFQDGGSTSQHLSQMRRLRLMGRASNWPCHILAVSVYLVGNKCRFVDFKLLIIWPHAINEEDASSMIDRLERLPVARCTEAAMKFRDHGSQRTSQPPAGCLPALLEAKLGWTLDDDIGAAREGSFKNSNYQRWMYEKRASRHIDGEVPKPEVSHIIP